VLSCSNTSGRKVRLSLGGFPNRLKYDSLRIETIRREFAADGQTDRDQLF